MDVHFFSRNILNTDKFRLSLVECYCAAALAMALNAELSMKGCVCISVLFKFFTAIKFRGA